MFVSFEDKVSSKSTAINILNKLKEYERTHKLKERIIGKCVVCCKNEEQFSEFEEAIANPKIY